MAARKPEGCRDIPRCLLTLHEKASGASLDGEGIQAWLEWEMEALRWGVPVEISRDELEALVGDLIEELVSPGTSSKAPKTVFEAKERA